MRDRRSTVLALGGLGVVSALALALLVAVGFHVWSNLGKLNIGGLAHGNCADGSPLRSPPPSRLYGTRKEVCTWGDGANPGALFHGAYASDAHTQERALGSAARLSGYTTWVDRVAIVPARALVDGYTGSFVRIDVRVFNRDGRAQRVAPDQFALWRRGDGFRPADFVGHAGALAVQPALASGAFDRGALWFYAGDAHGDLYVSWDPGDGTASTGVWHVARDGRPVSSSSTVPA